MEALRHVHASLPVFALDAGPRTLFYAPGHACIANRSQAAAIESELRGERPASPAAVAGRELAERARAALRERERQASLPFAPVCLTLSLSTRCNLACTYCHAGPHGPARGPVLEERVALAAAREVANHCVRAGVPFNLVVQGGGEPSLHWNLLVRLRTAIGALVRERGLVLRTYVSTNGALPATRAGWLGRHFDIVGLSVDGPPDVQDAQRPGRSSAPKPPSGAPTSVRVLRAAQALRATGNPFHVRATVTPATSRRQAEIVAWVLDVLGAQVVRLEPVYRAAPPAAWRPEDAEGFVAAFLAARRVAAARGRELTLSGARPGELHGPYCNPLRDVLQLAPDGRAVACFLDAGTAGPDPERVIGRYDAERDTFLIDQARADGLRRQAGRAHAACEACPNACHCALACPDVCVLRADEVDGFRCRVQRRLAPHLLRELLTVN